MLRKPVRLLVFQLSFFSGKHPCGARTDLLIWYNNTSSKNPCIAQELHYFLASYYWLSWPRNSQKFRELHGSKKTAFYLTLRQRNPVCFSTPSFWKCYFNRSISSHLRSVSKAVSLFWDFRLRLEHVPHLSHMFHVPPHSSWFYLHNKQ